MITATIPLPSIRLDVDDGFYIVVCDSQRNVTEIIDGSDFANTTVPKTTYCVRHVLRSGEVFYFDINEILSTRNLTELYLRLAGCSIFCGTCKNGIFKTDVTSMYNGKKIG